MKNRSKLVVCFLAVAFASYIPAFSQRELTASTPVRSSQEFLRLFYSDLSGKSYVMTLETAQNYDEPIGSIRDLKLYIGERPKGFIIGDIGGYTGSNPPSTYHPGPIYATQYLIADFHFDDQNRLLAFSVSGPAVGEPDRLDQIVQTRLNHKSMTANQASGTLIEAGAKFGPWNQSAFADRLPIQKLEGFLGKLTILSTEFPVPDKDHLLPNDWPIWTVTAKGRWRNGVELTYELQFEPFKGDLLSLVTVPYPPTAK